MFYKNELDFMPGVYKCYGDVQFLRFKIRLEIIKSSMISFSNVEEQETGLDPQYNEREEFEFLWNQKVFSPREFKYYSDVRNCSTPVENEYYNEINKLISGGTKSLTNRLFTYTSKDIIPIHLHKNIFYKEESCKHSSQENTLSSLFQQRLCVLNEKFQDWSLLPVRNIIDYYPSDELKMQNRSLFFNCETMYIVADLSDKSHNSENTNINNNEHILVTIKWNKKTHTLTVVPDFTSLNTAGYRIDVDMLSDTRYVYRYWLLNISHIEEESRIQKMEKLKNEFVTYRTNANFTLDFEIPFKNTINVFVFVEIQKATNFLCDNLFVQYFINLPSDWTAEKPDLLSGITQLCRCGNIENVVTFSYVFELKLTKTLSHNIQNENDISEYNWPQFFFEICSLDSWKRFRVEGYSWLSLPASSGRHKLILNTWRPASISQKDELKRFFIGCDPVLTDFTYPGVSVNDNSNLLSRYGFETISSGSIYLELNIMRQIGSNVTASRKCSHLADRKVTTLMNSVNYILEAFKKARQRMLLAREPILLHTGDYIR